MPRPSKWNTPTTAIRVPEHLAEQLLLIAKTLDKPTPSGFVQNDSPPYLVAVDDARYLCHRPPMPDGWMDEEIDRLIAEIRAIGNYTKEEAIGLAIARLAPTVGRKL